MALDPYLDACRVDKPDLLRAVRHAQHRGFSVVQTRDSTSVTLVRKHVDDDLKRIGTWDGAMLQQAKEVYGLLDDEGVVAVAGDGTRGTLQLKGGSVSQCSLVLGQAKPVVRKRVTDASLLPSVDVLERHRSEAKWIISRQNQNDNSPFPITRTLTDSESSLLIESEFIPAPTLGERFIHNRWNTESIKSIIQRLFEYLNKNLYEKEGSGFAGESYPAKLKRRLPLLFRDAHVGDVFRSFYQDGLHINGLECSSLQTQLNEVAEDSVFQEMILRPKYQVCHGDLIPEDILVNGDGSVLALVDPNPQNTDWLVDLGKFAMSCLVAYDLALRDWVRAALSCRGIKCKVDTRFVDGWGRVGLQQLEIGEWIAESAGLLVPTAVDDDWKSSLTPALLVLAGMQAICIAPFHLIHHRRPNRAIYFAALGQGLIERGLNARRW